MKRLLYLIFFLMISLSGFGQRPLKLMWSPSTDNVGVAGYCVWVDGVRLDSTENTYYDFGVMQPGEYLLTVSAYDAAGNESAQSEPLIVSVADVTVPEVPVLISVEYLDESAYLSWVRPDDNIGVIGYKIYLDGMLMDSTNINSYELNNLIPEKEYRISISAYDDAGNESFKSAEFIIELPIDKLKMSIYPNPSNGVFTLELNNGNIKNNTLIRFFTITGQIIYEYRIPQGNIVPYVREINLSQMLVEGSYVASLIENNVMTQNIRLIIFNTRTYQSNYNIEDNISRNVGIYEVKPTIVSDPNEFP